MSAKYRDSELDLDINMTQLDILLAIDAIIQDNGRCNISYNTLGKKLDKSSHCIKMNIRKLKELGLVTSESTYLYNGGRAENSYSLSTEAELLVCNFHINTSS